MDFSSEVNDKDKKMIEKVMSIMSEAESNETDLKFLVNNSAPTVEILQKIMTNRLVSLGMDRDEASSMLSLVAQMSKIAGGIAFADFATTEQMLESIKEQ